MHSLLHSDRIEVRIAFVVMVALAAQFLLRVVLPDPGAYPFDFRYFWLSGRLWTDGLSPYTAELQRLGAEIYPGARINPLFYPPSWRIISMAVALPAPGPAAIVWAGLSAGALIASAILCTRIVKVIYPAAPSGWRVFALFFAIVIGGAHAVEIAIQVGQPTPFLLLANAGLVLAILTRNQAGFAVALTVLLLKPQFGIPIALACVFMPSLYRGLAGAVVATGLLALYGLGAAPVETFLAFVHNLSYYGIFPENLPLVTSGPDFVLAVFGAPELSVYAKLAFVLALVAGAGAFIRRDGPLSTRRAALFVLFAATAAISLQKTHVCDYLLLAPLACVLWDADRLAAYLGLTGGVLVMRSLSLAVLVSDASGVNKYLFASYLDTIGAFCLLIGVGGALWRLDRTRRRPATTAPGAFAAGRA